MQQQVQDMIPDGVVVVEQPVQQEGAMQQRPHHMIQMADKRVPVSHMGIDENRVKIIVLKGASKGAGKGRHRQRNKKDARGHGPSGEPIHSIVILQRSLAV